MQPTYGEQWALPLIYSQKITIPYKTVIVATTDPAKPKIAVSTSRGSLVGITKQRDGSEWVWWTAKGSYLRAAVLVNGELPIVHIPKPKKPRVPKVPSCRVCEKPLGPWRTHNQKYCSKTCRDVVVSAREMKKRARKRPCEMPECRRKAPGRAGLCSKHYPHGHRERAAYWGVKYEPIVHERVYNRDQWICGLCLLPVDKKLKRPDLMSVSLDHIIPLSRGGDHLWDNVQCSHLICNMKKHNRLSL